MEKRIGRYRVLQWSLDSLDKIDDHPTLDQFIAPSRKLFPCQKVVLSILCDAFDCLRGQGYAGLRYGAMLLRDRGVEAAESEKWILDNSEQPFSFIWCCHSMGWESPEKIREFMLKFTNRTLIDLSQKVRFSIWKKDKRPGIVRKDKFQAALEIEGKRTYVGGFSTRKDAVKALHNEFILRGGGVWMNTMDPMYRTDTVVY